MLCFPTAGKKQVFFFILSLLEKSQEHTKLQVFLRRSPAHPCPYLRVAILAKGAEKIDFLEIIYRFILISKVI